MTGVVCKSRRELILASPRENALDSIICGGFSSFFLGECLVDGRVDLIDSSVKTQWQE